MQQTYKPGDIVSDKENHLDIFKVVEDTGGDTIDVVALTANGEDVSDRQIILDVERNLVQLYAKYQPPKNLSSWFFNIFRRKL